MLTDFPPDAVPFLPSKLRDRLLRAWCRWGHGHLAEAAVRAMIAQKGELVTYLDRLAEAQAAQGRHQEAAETLRRRRALRDTGSTAASEAKAWLDAGELAAARRVLAEAEALMPVERLAWLHFDLALAEQNWPAAEAALRVAVEDSSQPRLLSQARLLLARGQSQQAAELARRMLDRPEDALPLWPGTMRQLQAIFQAASDGEAAQRCRQLLEELAEREMTELAAELPSIRPSQPDRPIEPALPAIPQADVVPTAEELARLTPPLQKLFDHAAFRPGQAEVMAALLRGQSTLAVMPTGAGKSLCYQLPATLLPGATLVVSPLIALMKDQVDSLPAAMRHQATFINSSLEADELQQRLGRAALGHFKLIYAAPERLRQPPFLHALAEAGLSCFVIDEAHCVSLWGHDFRPDYLFMAEAHKALGKPTLLAMTATAPPRVQIDIQKALGDLALVAGDVHRPNLRLECRQLPDERAKLAALLELCQSEAGSGIIYANSRKKCEELAELLRRRGFNAVHYHAGIDNRAAVQDQFMSGRARIVVATVAFGMGIDKADIRFIVHFHPPRSLESYYQEAGRAGRDGQPARCILFYSSSDQGNLTRWARADALTIEYLRLVYAAVHRRLPPGEEAFGAVALDDLQRDLRETEDTRVRVGLSMLEQAELLRRGFDAPRAAIVTLAGPVGDDIPALAAFVEAARLRPGQSLELSLVDVARLAGLDSFNIEQQVLQWQSAGRLHVRPSGRDLLLARLPRPDQATQRIEDLLRRYEQVQQSRIAEIVGYAVTNGCRHGHISAYFGSPPRDDCGACDNCLGLESPPVAVPVRRQFSTAEIDRAVLECVRTLPRPVGRTSLALTLRGSPKAPNSAQQAPGFGALEGVGKDRILRHVDGLTEQGLLELFDEDRFTLIRLTEAGRQMRS